MNALQLCSWQFSHNENFVADFLQAKCDFTPKTVFLSFPLRGLGQRKMFVLISLESTTS